MNDSINKMSDNDNECNNSNNECNNSKDMSIRKRSSLVWQYFEKLSSVRVKCRICQHEQRYMGNTANALRHLKSKHDIDARAVGLLDPANVKRMKALTTADIRFEPRMAAIQVKNECFGDDDDEDEDEFPHNDDGIKDDERFKFNNPQRLSLYSNNHEPEIDPYNTNHEEPLMDVLDTTNAILNNKDDEEDTLIHSRNTRSSTNRKRSSLEDERIKAEIEYFREKAGYFRIQKHLTALQAKKVKFELEQLYAKK